VEARRIFGALDHHYYSATVAVYMGQAYLMTRTDEYDAYDSLNFCIDTGITEARMFSRIPYYRQLSELNVLQARLACSRREYNECAKHLADALADAVLFNRFQCEKIADQVVKAIAHEEQLKADFPRWGRTLQNAFNERVGQDKKSPETSKAREKLVQDIITWLTKLRENPTTTFPKRPLEEIRRMYLMNKTVSS
jgi:hypothetical protein